MRRKYHSVGWGRRLTLLAVAVAVTVGGCRPAPPDVDAGFKVRQRDPADVGVPPPVIAQSAKVSFRVLRVELPLDRSTRGLWSLLDESVLPDVSRVVWNGNGLRLGVLQPGDRDEFFEALAPVVDQTDIAFTASDRPTPLRVSPPLNATFTADLTRPGTLVRREQMEGGRLQLLAAVRPAAAGVAQFSLTPHHYKHRFSLTPRNVLEKELDGRVYDELGVDVSLAPEQVLVLGLYRDEPPEAPADGETGAGESEGDGFFGDIESAPATGRLPLDFGRGLLTSGRTPDDTQYLFLLRVEDLGG